MCCPVIMAKVNFQDKFSKFDEHWTPKVIAEMNDYQFKLVKIKDDLILHKHDDTDEVFIVIKGEIFIEFENETINLTDGEMIVVPKGIKHRPFANNEAMIMIVEPRGVVNTGDQKNDLTAPNDQWV